MYEMCVYTGRAAAASVAVAVTCLAGLRGGAGVGTCTATLQERHVVLTFLVCRDKHVNLAVPETIKPLAS